MRKAMALKKESGEPTGEDPARLPDATWPTALWVEDELKRVAIADQRRPERHAGECSCSACVAKLLSDLPVRFY